MHPIKFYKPTERYGEFSNFSDHPIAIDGELWPTTEHYFQAQKFAGTKFEKDIRLLKTPMEAKIAGQDKSHPIRNDWERVKDNIMRKAIFQKFSQYPDLKKLLLSTADSYLIESANNDSYWGGGKNCKGKNMLGIILMETREKLRD